MSAPQPIGYICPTDCDVTCSGAEACNSCLDTCTAEYDYGGPWGGVADVFFCLLPIIFLLFVTLKPNPWASTASLPTSAVLMFLVRLAYLGLDPLLTCGAAVAGIFEAITPISIAAGAIFLFESMESTGCMPWMMREMKVLSGGHPVAEVLLIGWAFAYMIEGASGFGTPVALGAPMLASLGHGKFESVVCLLLMNTLATMFGAAGTPIWYGLGSLGLSDDQLRKVGFNSAVIVGVIAFIIVPMITTFLVPVRVVLKSILFVGLAISSCVLPSIGLSTSSFEFPTILGGMIGCALTMALIRFKIGLKPVNDAEAGRSLSVIDSISYIPARDGSSAKEHRFVVAEVAEFTHGGSHAKMAPAFDGTNGSSSVTANSAAPEKGDAKEDLEANGDAAAAPAAEDAVEMEKEKAMEMDIPASESVDARLGPRPEGRAYYKAVVLRTLPLWGVVVILVLTRVQQFGIKSQLTRQDPAWTVQMQTFADFRLSVALVFQLNNILTNQGLNWKFETLYVPSIIPFLLMSLITVAVFRKELQTKPMDIARCVGSRMVSPAKALFGALVLVQLFRIGGQGSPAYILGNLVSNAVKQGWIVFSPFIGALGSFFSGSTTISNLTFGGVQQVAAENINVSVEGMLALQVCGATLGNSVCLSNIVSACAVMGLTHLSEGLFIKKTAPLACLFAVLSIVLGLGFLNL